MTRNILQNLLIIAALAVATALHAQPVVRFMDTTWDFGAFDENDGTVTCTFTYVNDGNEPLSIVAARATCGCTTPTYTRDAVEPGDTGRVDVSYNPTGRPGRFSKKVYVDFNTDIPRTTLTVKGVVIGSGNTLRGRYPVDEGELKLRTGTIMFGDLKNGKSKSAFFEVYNATADTLTPQWTRLPHGVRQTTTTPSIPPGEQATYTFYFVASGDELYGILTDSLLLQARPGGREIKVDMTAIIEEDFSTLTPAQRRDAPRVAVSPVMLDYDILRRSDGPQQRAITLRNTGRSPLLIRRVYSVDPAITVTVPQRKLKPGKEMQIQVTADPALVSNGFLNARVNIIVNDPLQPGTAIRAVGEVRD